MNEVQNNVPANPKEIGTKPAMNNTYCVVGNETDGFIEFDLVSFRQKGEEKRYAHINMVGFTVDAETGEEVPNDTFVKLFNKEDFEKFKKFIATLNWND